MVFAGFEHSSNHVYIQYPRAMRGVFFLGEPMAKLTLSDVASGLADTDLLNANNTLVETALENTLSRDGTTPNGMAADLDMNSNKITNMSAPVDDNDAARKVDLISVLSADLSGTSTTSVLIGTGSKVFTTQSGKQFGAGTFLVISSDADVSNFMFGQVTAYSSTTLTVNVTAVGGAGTLADWSINLSGTQGAAGAAGAMSGPGTSTDNAVARFNGTSGDIVQDSSVIVSDLDAITGVTSLTVDNLNLNGNTIISTDTNGDILLAPNGTGDVILDTTGSNTSSLNLRSDLSSGTAAQLEFTGNDSGAADQQYGLISASVSDATAGSEDSSFIFNVQQAGSQLPALNISGSVNTFFSNTTICDIFIRSGLSSGSTSQISFDGQNSAASNITYSRIITAIDNNTSGSEASSKHFQTQVAGALGTRLILKNGLYSPSATGGDKGSGTANFQAVYDDNVLLTCYVADAYIDGEIDVEKWDGYVGDLLNEVGDVVEERQHVPAREYAAMLGGEYDPLDLDKYFKHFTDKRQLVSLPNREEWDSQQSMSTGELAQKLWETVETQAVHIEKLNQRLKALENDTK